MPIVLLSGYTGPASTRHALAAAAGITELLAKPVLSRQIAASLARVLNRTP